MSNKSAAEPTEEQVRAAAEVIAGSPTIDAPKLPWPAWCGLARAILRAARIETRSMGDSPVGDESHRRSAEEAKGCHEAPDAPGESPAATLRAALAQPQEGEAEECADRLEAMAEGYSAEAAKFFRNAARLLRATQSNEHSPVGDESPRQNAKGAEGCHDAPNASGESPAQSAPVQEPVATLEAKVSTLLDRALTTGYGSTEAIYALANLAREPLYAAPPPDEAMELMQLLVQRYDDYRGKGISSAPGWYQMVVDAIERIRAFLKDRT